MEAHRRLDYLVVYQKFWRLHLPESARRQPSSSVREESENDGANPNGFSEP
jgi:hypothetical protein